jgi:hypothetical protein
MSLMGLPIPVIAAAPFGRGERPLGFPSDLCVLGVSAALVSSASGGTFVNRRT